MIKKLFQTTCVCLLIILMSPHQFITFAASVSVTGVVLPSDATNLAAVDAAPGTGEVVLTWTTSPTPNINIQRIEITGPQGPGVNFTTKDLPFQIIDGGVGPNTTDDYSNYAPSTNITGLTIGETYIIRIVSIAGTLESPGAAPGALIFFVPAAANPAPILLPEPTVTTGTDNTLYWTNGGIDDVTLTCRLTASFADLNVDPLGTIEEDSGWIPCPTSTITYDHTFSGLTINSTYFYHVQTNHPIDGLSPYSNVEFSQQTSSSSTGGGGGGSTVACGNSILESGEECDDGNRTPGDGCNEFCNIEPAICGNNIVEAPETCDDGNTTSGDGCSDICLAEAPIECGNAVLETGEQCDDGNLLNNDGCSSSCTFEVPEFCGNGIVQAPEQCDDGNNISGDGCSAICEVEHAAAPVCGDAFREDPEECDDGNLVDGDGCSAICTLEILPACGNAILEAPEECDDGNLLNFDGCDEFCIEEEIVEVFLHITGSPEHRKTNYYNLPEDERTTSSEDEFNLSALLDFASADLFRIDNTPNLGLNADLLLYKPAVGSLDSVGTTLDNFGEGFVAVEVITGSYDFALNGEAHNNRVLRNIVIDGTMEGEIVELDFTKAEIQQLVAGDTRDDNLVNALDIATMLGSYKATGNNVNDLNKDESPIVNAIDIAILLWNYKKVGEVL